MSKKFNLYLGKAGQLATMSYFLMRGWNVATPEVDIGDDLLVIEDRKGVYFRVQVKTAKVIERQDENFSVRFNLSLNQLRFAIDPEIYYVFVVCRKNEWSDKVIISREALFDLHTKYAIGSIYKENLVLYFTFQEDKILCSSIDFTKFKNNFDNFPTIQH